MLENKQSAKQVFIYILKMVLPFKLALFTMMVVNIIWAIDLSVSPYIVKIIVNRINELPAKDIASGLLIPAICYIAMSLLVTTGLTLYNYLINYKMIPELRKKIARSSLDKLLGQSQNYYQNNFAGSLANNVNSLIDALPEIWQIVTDRFLSHALGISFAIYTLWQVNLFFALTTLIWCIIFIIISFVFSKKLAKLSDNYSEKGSKLVGTFVDIFSNILSIKLFAGRKFEAISVDKNVDEVVLAERKVQWFYMCRWGIGGYSFAIVQSFNIYFLISFFERGLVTIGDFALVLTINSAIIDCLWAIAREFSRFSKYYGKITQAMRSINQIAEVQDQLCAKNLKINKASIIFDDVEFHYNSATALFKNLNIKIENGQKVGLVGYSGAGKTTFVNLILRLYNLTTGRIIIDGQDISSVTQDSLRANISMIPQNPSLFHRSLMDNIRYGNINATDEEVIETAKKAHIHEFIVSLPEKYNSLVGEQGVKLSGGQRQRIAIARAILKDAPILILDEATSQMDSITENYIQESLLELMQSKEGKTTIVIAHRLSTLLKMDRILVFESGRIVEDGSHDELLTKFGLYKKLWDAQIGGFLPQAR